MKPKLTTRKFVSSAKINLNRYWHKLEELIVESTVIKKNKKKLKKLKTVNLQLLNNRIHPLKANSSQITANSTTEQINSFVTKRFPLEKNLMSGRYKQFAADDLYHGVNLNPVSPLITEKYYDNYCYYLQEPELMPEHQNNNHYHHYNNSALYQQQLSESTRRKGYKFTLADIAREDNTNYYRGMYLEDEGYLV